MPLRILVPTAVSSAVMLVIGLFIGYTSRSPVNVEVYDPAACQAASTDFWNGLNRPVNALGKDSPDAVAILQQMKRIRPLVKAGPFEILWNSGNNDYLIFDTVSKQSIAMQMTQEAQAVLSLFGRGGQVCCDLTYEKDSQTVRQTMFLFHTTAGATGLPKYTYMDRDGDGRFDIMVDRAAGARYEQRGLQWVELDRVEKEE
jgi:hypothetical protein